MTPKGKKEQITLARSPRWQALLDGDLAIEDLHDDELLAGRLRDATGRIAAKGPRQIPRQLHERMMRELRSRMENKFAEHVSDAVDTIVDIMHDGEGEQFSQFEKAGTKRLQAAIYVVERVMGKMEQKTVVSGEVTLWQEAVEGGDFLVELEDPPVVTAEVVDETGSNAPARARPPVRRRRPREGA